MRTNIELDEKIIKEAFRYSKAKTKKELIHEALRRMVEEAKRMDLRKLKGKIHFQKDYDYKSLRKGA